MQSDETLQAYNALKWRCRRGMKEMDILLDVFMETHYQNLSCMQQHEFKQLLDLQDPELFGVLMRHISSSQQAITDLVDLINPRIHQT